MMPQPDRFMKRTSTLLALALIALGLTAALPSVGGTLYPVIVGGRWGYMDKHGSLVINPQFDRAEPFASGVAAFRLGHQWGYVNAGGKKVITPQFDAAGNFTEGRAVVRQKHRYGYIDKSGTVVITVQFESAGSFSEGLAAV